MTEVNVRPEQIHTAATGVDGAGQDWGESFNTLSSEMEGVEGAYGGDEIGVALKEMYELIGPTALRYFEETGFCVLETAVAMDQMAEAYTTIESDNTKQAQKVQTVIDSLGDL